MNSRQSAYREKKRKRRKVAFNVGFGDWFGVCCFSVCISLLLNAEIIQTSFFLFLIDVTLFVSRYCYLNVL